MKETTRRALTLGFGTLVGLSAGTNYVFSAYAPQLAAKLNLTSVQLNTIGPAGNLGVYLSGVAGIGASVDKRGPRATLWLAAGCLFTGYALIKAFYDGGEGGLFAVIGMPGLILAQFLTGVGSTAGVASASNATAKSFDKSRGLTLSIILAGLGLSAFFYSSLGRLLLQNASDFTSSFLLLLAIGTMASMLLGIIFIRAVPPTQPDEPEVPEAEPEPSERTPLVVVKGPSASSFSRISTATTEAVDVTGWALLREFDFWAIFLFNGFCSGIGLMYINNLGTVTRSLASPLAAPREVAIAQATLVSLLSIFNCLGRLASGGLSDFFLHRAPERFRIARVNWQLMTGTTFLLSQIAASQATRIQGYGLGGLALPTMLTGFSHGSLFGMSGVLVIGRFGMKAFSFNNSMLALAPAIAGQLCNLMFGAVYDSHVRSSGTDSAGFVTAVAKTCSLERACYVEAFHVSTGMSLAAIVVAVVLTRRRTMQN